MWLVRVLVKVSPVRPVQTKAKARAKAKKIKPAEKIRENAANIKGDFRFRVRLV